MRPLLCLLLFVALLPPGWANPLPDRSAAFLDTLRDHAERRALATQLPWLALLQYQPPVFGRSPVSQADDPAFFLAPTGHRDPAAELAATLAAFLSPSGDQHAQCRFPARFHWLRQQGEPFASIPAVPCPELEQWLRDLNTERVTLVFASSYLNSPSSMFGHTFLRLDPPNLDQGNPILAHTISYAADASEHDNELLFAYRGIFGGYPGITTIEPYYDKIRLYSEIENRDLWEYQLDLAPDEVRQLLRHAWEIRNVRFDYFFFDENCAYRILTLVDVARPGTNLIPQLAWLRAIPSDTVRVVVANDLVSQVRYRPSQATLLGHQLEQLTAEEQTLAARSWTRREQPAASDLGKLSPERQAALLEASYQFARYRTLSDQLPREATAKLSYDLLQARSQVPAASPLTPPLEPQIRDDQGHATGRGALAYGRYGERNFATLALRPAYHDLQDPAPGYRPGSQLQFLNTELRYYFGNDSLGNGTEGKQHDLGHDELQLERLDAVSILSLTPRNQFFQPLSWAAAFGADRQLTDEGQRPLAGYVEGGAGYSYKAGGTLVYGMVTGAARFSGNLRDGYQAGPGATLGWSYQATEIAWQFNIASRFFPEQEHDPLHRLAGHLDWHWQPDWSLTLGLERERSGEVYATTAKAGFKVYF